MHLRNSFSSLCIALLALTLAACSFPWSKEETTKKANGTRIEALAMDTQLLPDASLAATPPALPAPNHFPESPSVHDSVSVGEGQRFTYNVSPSPVLGDGLVYGMDAVGHISAHEALDITHVRWRANGVADADENTMLTGGMAYANGTLYAVSGNGLVAAFEGTTGRELWRQDIKIPMRSAPKVGGNHVFVVTIDSQLFALDAATGANLWNARGINEGSSFLALASPAVAEGVVVAPFSSGELKVLQSADGAEVWSDLLNASKRMLATANFGGFGGDPVVVDNALYVVSASGVLAAYRLDNGLRVWEQPVASTQTPLVAGDTIFVLASDASLVAVNRLDGRIFWTAALPRYENAKERKDPYHWSGPVLAGSRLYVVGAHGEMKAFNPENGSETATIEIPDDAFVAPVVIGARMVLLRKNADLVAVY